MYCEFCVMIIVGDRGALRTVGRRHRCTKYRKIILYHLQPDSFRCLIRKIRRCIMFTYYYRT